MGWWCQRGWVALVVLLMLWGGMENRVFAQENSDTVAETLIMQTSPSKVKHSDGVFVVDTILILRNLLPFELVFDILTSNFAIQIFFRSRDNQQWRR